MINTLEKFLDATGFARGTNHPSVSSLKSKMRKLNVSEDLAIDIMSFFLYDHESTDDDYDTPVIKHFKDDNDRDSLDDFECTIKHFQD